MLEALEPSAAFAVAVVDDDARSRTRLAMQLGDHVRAAAFSSLTSLREKLTPSAPVVVVLGASYVASGLLAEAEAFIRLRPEIGAVLVVDELRTDVLQSALRAGVRDVLASPDAASLLDAVRRMTESLAPAVPVAPTTDDPAPEISGEFGRIVTVFSTKGGAGKSVIATNLAVELQRRSGRPVALVDADLQFGDVAVMLKLTPEHTVVDAVNAIDRLDASLLQSLMIRHEPSGVLVLAAPIEPAFADQIAAAQMTRILEVLRTFCGFIVVDTPAYFNDVVLSLLEQSEDILLVAGMDIPNIKNVKIGLQTLRLLNTPVSKLKLVLNRANSKVKLDVAEVERTLGIKADALIPSDVAVPLSVNKGMPILIDAPKSSVARSIEQLADLFAPAAAFEARRRWR